MSDNVPIAQRLREAIAVGPLLAGRSTPLPEGGIVLGYHDIGAVGDDSMLSAGRFERQMRQLVQWGFRVVPLDHLVTLWSSGEALDGLVAITFDDAGSGVLRFAVPVLADLGMPATVFVPTGLLGHEVAWRQWTDRVMTRSELEQLGGTAITLGSHCVTHRSLPELNDHDLREELVESRRELLELTGHEVELLAYPFGHQDDRVQHAARDAGYAVAFTYTNGRIVGGEPPFALPRLTMREAHGPVRFAAHLMRPARNWPASAPA